MKDTEEAKGNVVVAAINMKSTLRVIVCGVIICGSVATQKLSYVCEESCAHISAVRELFSRNDFT